VKANTTTASPPAAETRLRRRKILRWKGPNCPM
jgi:hypothetical protein